MRDAQLGRVQEAPRDTTRGATNGSVVPSTFAALLVAVFATGMQEQAAANVALVSISTLLLTVIPAEELAKKLQKLIT